MAKECGAAVDIANSFGQTPLAIAALGGHFESVRVLATECGAAVDASDIDGHTALFCASSRGHTDIVRFLSKAVVDATVPPRM